MPKGFASSKEKERDATSESLRHSFVFGEWLLYQRKFRVYFRLQCHILLGSNIIILGYILQCI